MPGVILGGRCVGYGAHLDHPRREPTSDVEPIQDVGGMAEMLGDGGAVGAGTIRHHHVHTLQPPVALRHQEPGQCGSVAVSHNSQRLAGVAVDQHRHIPVAAAEAGLVDQQDPAAAPAALFCDPVRPVPGQSHDEVPRKVVAAGHFPDRHGVDVPHQLAGQAPGHMRTAPNQDLGMVLPRPLRALSTREATTNPHQSRRASMSR